MSEETATARVRYLEGELKKAEDELAGLRGLVVALRGQLRDRGYVDDLVLPEQRSEPECGFDYHDMSDKERCGIPCLCQPHSVGGAYGCPEGCPTHNPGGPDVPEGAVGGPATDEQPLSDAVTPRQEFEELLQVYGWPEEQA